MRQESDNMINTIAGLPNSCSRCGKKCTAELGWYAENIDAARAGGGICSDCAMPPTIPPTVTTYTKAETTTLSATPAPHSAKRKAKKAL